MAVDQAHAEFEVGITYCNDFPLTHQHDDVHSATTEYADMMAIALIEHGETKDDRAKHVRLVTLIRYDPAGNRIWHVDSGVFSCDHRVDENN